MIELKSCYIDFVNKGNSYYTIRVWQRDDSTLIYSAHMSNKNELIRHLIWSSGRIVELNGIKFAKFVCANGDKIYVQDIRSPIIPKHYDYLIYYKSVDGLLFHTRFFHDGYYAYNYIEEVSNNEIHN